MTSLKHTALLGYSMADHGAFTQQIAIDGTLINPDISSDSWKGDWYGLTTFKIEGGSDQNAAYVFGCGGSAREIFIQAFTAYGAFSLETYRETTGNAYNVCCSYTIGGKTYVLMHDTAEHYYAIRAVTSDGKLAAGFVENGKWSRAYASVFAVWAGGELYLAAHSKSGNRFFLQKILSNGKLDSKESCSQDWANYYDTLIGVEVGSRAFVFGQQSKNNHWFTQEIKSNGTLESKEADNGTWGDYYPTMVAAVTNGGTYIFAQSKDNKRWFSQKVGSDGKLASSEAASGNYKNFYSYFGAFDYDPPPQTDNWMTDLYESILKTKTLKQIMMPGSHDAGMSQSVDCTIKGNSGNTQTQSLKIGQQLLAGARYFDIRPVACATRSVTTYRTGHFSDISVIGWQGCYGQSMDSICADIMSFCNGGGRSKELIILKFSHYLANTDGAFSGGWTDSQKNAFAAYLQTKLGDVMIRYSGSPRLGTLTYEQLMALSRSGTKPKVLIVFDNINQSVRNTQGGIFRYADYPYDKADPSFISPYVDLCVYDDYSNTSDVDVMVAEQKKMMMDPANHGGDMFLLSWTLTLQYDEFKTVYTDISDLAVQANQRLTPAMQSWMSEGEITAATLPNVLYVDYLSNQQADLCRNMLRQFYKK